ncbi:MAG TPA: hypothetical protein VJK05_03870 [archaeon]|nr:hypothetical protein [archaeon]
MQTNKNILIGSAAIIVVLVAVLAFNVFGGKTAPGQYNEFAECLTEKGAKMYGAFWCPHCADQKESFGESWSKVNYIECSSPDGKSQLPSCAEANIKGYPTWEFADGSRMEGFIPLQDLSQKTGCALN